MTISRTQINTPDVSNAGSADLAKAMVAQLNNLGTNAVDRTGRFSDQSTITLGTPASAQQTATIQIKDEAGTNVAAVQRLEAYMCTDSAGATPSSAGANTSVTATTGAILNTIAAKLKFELLTNASGQAVLNFNNTSGAGTYADRVAVVLPNGKILVSAALAVPNA
jgi:hypothetical protein